MASQADISTQLCQALAITEPDLDTSVGSVTRKIIDAVASQISDASLDTQMLTYQYDIYSMTGSALDSFVQLFGMSRYPAAPATGTVTFTRPTATDVISIPINSQVSTSDGSVVVQALATAILDIGALSVAIPVQATVSGPAGNVAANTLTQVLTQIPEVSSVTNLAALTGGANQETDSQLQARWVATVFKSMAGTNAMFLGTALNNPGCTLASVVGASTSRREQVQIINGAAASTVPDAQYIYPSGQVVGQDIDNGNVAVPGLQYNWDYSVIPPQIQVIDTTYFPNGSVVDLAFQYISTASRNQPAESIFNRVDVWCAGSSPVPAAATAVFQSLLSFSSSPSSNYYAADFVRPDGTQPTAGNIFIPLPFGPIVTMDATIAAGSVTYGLATAADPLGTTSGGVEYAYQIVHRTGAFGWSPYSDFGLEWQVAMSPISSTVLSIGSDYTYNSVPLQVQNDLQNWALAATDVQAHQAIEVQLQFSLAVIYDPSITVSVTQAAIATSLANYLTQLGFDSWVYPGSVIQAVEATPGVVACRFITGADISGYNSANPDAYNVGIQQIVNGTVVQSYVDSSGNPLDVPFGESTIPTFGAVQLITRAANSMGAFS
jgi:uncharacterized phage protein gp47/JayE